MATSSLLTTLTLLLSFSSSILAQPTMVARAAASSTNSGSFPTITDTENTGALEGGTSSSKGGPAPGADGSDHGAFKMSTGALVGIVVAVAIVVILFIVMWALWFFAKRREWGFRDTVKYASKRMTGRAAVPPTPRTPAPRTPRTPRVPRNVEAAAAAHRTKTPAKSSLKPHAGWLADEKERSRSRSPEDKK